MRQWREKISDRVYHVNAMVEFSFREAPRDSRKEFALWVKKNVPYYAPYLFAKLDGEDYRDMILRREFDGL